ncbi:response regulator [Portibacter marinus]|uniref:response regulator n=1 Tax=Portibacter marinus TaxID=2898660 RepID=UPI001F28AE9B|nr:response regulator [Portibacter marinus]
MDFKNLKFLILEDSTSDFVLAKHHLSKEFKSPQFTHCEDLNSFKEVVTSQKVDIIVSDFELKGATGLEALLFMVTQDIDIPFVFCTGALNNEEKAAETILQGADGYILKDNIESLANKVKSVLAKKFKEKQEKDVLKTHIDEAISLSAIEKGDMMMDKLVDQFEKVQGILKVLQKNL